MLMSVDKTGIKDSEEISSTSVPYIQSSKILISNRTLELNNHTWTDSGVYQKHVVEFFSQEIAKNPSAIVLDIGAQSGAFSLLAKYHPETKWFCFECDPTNYSLLQENIKLNNVANCFMFPVAVSSQSGKATLRRSTHFGLHTLGSNPRRFAEDLSLNVEVETVSIDEFVAISNLPSVDFIKIDTEGCELNILRGAINTIKKFKPKILLEYYGENLEQFGHTQAQLIHFITDDLSYVQAHQLDDNLYIVCQEDR